MSIQLADSLTDITKASGLTLAEVNELEALINVFRNVKHRNENLERYYEGDVMVKDIGVDILSQEAKNKVHVDLSSDWAKKSVKALSNHVRFDGFVFEGRDGIDEGLNRAIKKGNFESAFSCTRIGTLKKGCSFACVNNYGKNASVTFHSADNGAAIINPATREIDSGFVIADIGTTNWSNKQPVIRQVNLHLRGSRVEIIRDDVNLWHAEHVETPQDVIMMIPFVYEPTDKKPLGGTRITKDVQSIIDQVLSARLAIAISQAFYAVPMRALLGLTEPVYNALKDKPQWTAYINPFLMATATKQGTSPTLTQLPSNSPQALISVIETQAKLFSGATGVPLNSLGIVQDNPSSAEAIIESRRDLIEDAQTLIEEQMKPSLRQLALLVMMVEHNKSSVDDLDDIQQSVMAHFKNPAMPSIAATTDAAMKMANVNPAFAQTDVFYEMIGFDRADIARINAQIRMNQARANVSSMPILSQNRTVEEQTVSNEINNTSQDSQQLIMDNANEN